MLLVVDDFLPVEMVGMLKTLCELHHALKQNADADALFSRYRADGSSHSSLHSEESKSLLEGYLNNYIREVCSPSFVNLTFDKRSANPLNPGHSQYFYEWWCNTNNHLDWHIDKDEVGYRENGRYALPLLSTVFYPHVSCAGGELLVADNPPMQAGQTGPPPRFRSVISIPPAVNRLVVFSPGILHRINQLEGERYSIAVNIWQSEPLTTQESAPPA